MGIVFSFRGFGNERIMVFGFFHNTMAWELGTGICRDPAAFLHFVVFTFGLLSGSDLYDYYLRERQDCLGGILLLSKLLLVLR